MPYLFKVQIGGEEKWAFGDAHNAEESEVIGFGHTKREARRNYLLEEWDEYPERRRLYNRAQFSLGLSIFALALAIVSLILAILRVY